VVILGAGINGAAVARDLAINGVPVVVVDQGDVAQGATSRSSRLIHGGLRYLEYRDLTLVRESLLERERLLQTAPHFVRPLRLKIPVARCSGGLIAAAVKFCGLASTRLGGWLLNRFRSPRGLIAVRIGLWLYDLLARGSSLPRHAVARSTSTRWQCSYWDAQIEFPERFVLSMLHDAQKQADSNGVTFQVLTRHSATLEGTRRDGDADRAAVVVQSTTVVESCEGNQRQAPVVVTPAVVINATGAWGDLTLRSLGVDEKRLFAGTRGSHLFTAHRPLCDAVGDCGVYAEAADGRLVFILPLGRGALIGTTDLPQTDSPDTAVATDDEIEYLIEITNAVLPEAELRREHVEVCHAGVRPLPRTESLQSAAIPRGHSLNWSDAAGLPVATLIGGKLTTCRRLAEEVTDAVLDWLGLQRTVSTERRRLPGHPAGPSSEALSPDSTRCGLSAEQAAVVRRLVGDRLAEITASAEFIGDGDGNVNVHGTTIPRGFVRWSMQYEWGTNLNDLVERRLMLIFEPELHRETLEELADLLVVSGRLDRADRDAEVERCIESLAKFQGKCVLPEGA
jgi:glycerol-3-phosphate dehydrogenase